MPIAAKVSSQRGSRREGAGADGVHKSQRGSKTMAVASRAESANDQGQGLDGGGLEGDAQVDGAGGDLQGDETGGR